MRNFIGGAAALLGMSSFLSPAQQYHQERGKAPKGKRWVFSSAYTPAGPHKNTRGTSTVPAKVAAQMNAMHDKWWAAKSAKTEVVG